MRAHRSGSAAPLRRLAALAAGALAALAATGCPPAPDRTCRAVSAEPTPSAAQVCGRLRALDCRLAAEDAGEACAVFYADWQSRTDPAEFNRLASCYVHSASCEEVDWCNRSCGQGGGPVVPDGGPIVGDAGEGGVSPTDASADVGADAGADSQSDAGADAASDAGADAASDAGADSQSDAAADDGG